MAVGNIKGLLRSTTLAGWAARSAVKAFPVLYLDDAPVLQQLNRYIKSQVRRQQKNRAGLWEKAAEAERCRLNYYLHLRSSILWAYFKPYRKHFWNVKEYWEYGPIGIRQHGGPIRHITITSTLATFYLRLWRQLLRPREQRRLEAWRRHYKIDCWWGDRFFDARPSAYLQLGDPNNPYGRFDQRPCAYLYPEHAPRPERFGGRVICLPPRDHAKLKATQKSHNNADTSYWNSSSMNYRGRVDRFDGQWKVLSEKFRDQRSLNIPRETIGVRNNLIANLEHDFGRVEAGVA